MKQHKFSKYGVDYSNLGYLTCQLSIRYSVIYVEYKQSHVENNAIKRGSCLMMEDWGCTHSSPKSYEQNDTNGLKEDK